MSNTLGIPEVTLAEAGDATNAVNLTNTPECMGGNVIIRITDHQDNDETEVTDVTDSMAIFNRKAHGFPWMRVGTHLTALNFHADGVTAVPTNVEVLFPNFDYTEFE